MVYDSRTLALTRRVRASRPMELAVSADGRTMAVATVERGLVLANTRTGHTTGLSGTGPIPSSAFSADGHWLAVSDGNKLQLWDRRGPMRRPERSIQITLDQGIGIRPAFDPGGRWLAIAQTDRGQRRLELRSLPRLHLVRQAVVPEGEVGQFAPGGRTFAYGDAAGRTWLYDTSTLAPEGAPLDGHDGPVRSVAFSPDGRLLVTTSAPGAARLWDLTSKPPTSTSLTSGKAPVTAAAFIRDGSRLVTIAGDGETRLWDLRPREWIRHACAVAGRSLTRDEWQESLPGRPYAPVCHP